MPDWQLIQQVANWVGWPVIVFVLILIGSGGYFILRNRINTLNENNAYLRDQLVEASNYHPDRVVARLTDRYRIQNEVVEELETKLGVSEEELQKEKAKVEEIEAEIGDLAEKLNKAYSELVGDLPRAGKFRIGVADYLLESALIHSFIVLPLSIHEEPFMAALNGTGEGHEIVLTEDSGMSKIHLALEIDGSFCGQIKRRNISSNIIGNDYIFTVSMFLAHLEEADAGPMGGYRLPPESSILQRKINGRETFWVKVPMTVEQLSDNPRLRDYMREKAENTDFL